jgi:hypothetical protein
MKAVARNIAAAAVAFLLAVGIDYLSIRQPIVEIEMFVLTPLAVAMVPFVPFAFWFANRRRFGQRPKAAAMRVGLAIALALAWFALAVVPLFHIHTLLGGSK